MLSSAEWQINKDAGSTGKITVSRENIDGQEREVLTLEVKIGEGTSYWYSFWAGARNLNDTLAQKLREASGVRFKVLGDGKIWSLIIPMRETSTDNGAHRANFSTRNGRVVEIDIPFSRLRQPEWGKKVTFNKNSIIGMEIERNNTLGSGGAAAIKIFDIEVY
jgi:hypothetical protein